MPVPASAETEADRAKLASLLRYEVMVRAQDADHAATAAHLRPAFDALRELGGEEEEEEEEAGTARAGRGGAGRRARGGLMGFGGGGGGGGGRRRRAGAGAGDGRDALSAAALVGAHRRLRSGTGTEMDILRSDRQLMYVLEELADACSSSGPWGGGSNGWGGSPGGGVPPAVAATGADGGGTEAEAEAEGNLAFPDFLCAYRTAIAGMQCLQVPDGDAGGDGGEDLERRRRVIDRTALLVRSFGPRRTDGGWGWGGGGGGGWGWGVGTAPAPPKPATPPSAFSARRLGRTSGRGLRRTTEGGPDGEEVEGSGGGGGRGGRGGGTDGGGDEGGPSEARLRHLLAVKDRQMARILSDQNQAADALGAEEGRRRARRGHRRRQRRQWARVGAVLVPALLLSLHWTGMFRWGGGGEEGGMGAGGPAFSAGSLFRSRSRELADLKRRARIALLESAEKELRIELASTRARLEVAAQDLARARDQVRDALTDASSCGPSGVASPSVALAACRAELRRAR